MLLDVLFPLGLLIVIAKLVEGVLGRFGLSSIVAYTVTGVILGPVLGIVLPSPEIQLFLGLGIFVLFFLVGLDEIDIQGFVATIRGRYFVAAMLSVIISLVSAMLVTSDLAGFSFALGLHFDEALALAGILSLSSLGLVAKVLADSGHLKEPIGLKIFTIVAIAEVAALLVVGFTIGEHHEPSVLGLVTLLLQIAGFVVVTWVLSTRVLPPAILFLQRFVNVPELSFGLLLGGLFLIVVGAEKIGLHGTLGALLFGVALSGLPQRIHWEIMPGMRSASEGLFVPLFFASAGLQFDLSFTAIPLGTIVALAVIPLAGKFVGAFLSTYLTRIEAPFTLATGLMSKGVAEIALLLVLLELGVIGQDVFSLFVLIMFGYILFMPPIIGFAIKRTRLTSAAVLPQSVPLSYVRRALQDVKVSSVLDRTRTYPGPEVTVQNFTEDWVVPKERDYVVVVGDGKVAGIVSLAKIRSIGEARRASTTLAQILRPKIPPAWSDEMVVDVMERMAEHSMAVMPIRDRESGEFVGTVESQNLLDLVVLMDEIKKEAAALRALQAAQLDES